MPASGGGAGIFRCPVAQTSRFRNNGFVSLFMGAFGMTVHVVESDQVRDPNIGRRKLKLIEDVIGVSHVSSDYEATE